MMKHLICKTMIGLLAMLLNAQVWVAYANPVSKPQAEKHVFGVHGLSCPFCVIGIKKTFKKIKGVQSVQVSLKRSIVIVYTNKNVCFSTKSLKQIFEKSGFAYHGTIEQPKSCGKSL